MAEDLSKFFTYIQTSQEERKPDESFSKLLERTKLEGLDPAHCQEGFKRQWMLNQSYLDLLNEFSKDCPKAIILKGSHLLLEGIYSFPAHRFMGDVDLLIREEDQGLWKDYLTSKGFSDITNDSKGTWEANNFKRVFLKEDQELEFAIELHTRLFFQEELNFSWETQDSRLKPFSILTNEDLFIHLCGHLAYQHTFISLHWLYDLFKLVQVVDLDFKKIEERAKKAQVLRSCQLVLWCLREYFNGHSLPSLGISPFVRSLAKIFLTKSYLVDPTNFAFSYMAVKHLSKDHLHQAIIYDLLWFKSRMKKEIN